MAAATLPAIDANICAQWSQDDIANYNMLPYYFVKATAAYQKYRSTWNNLLKTVKWTPNQGDTMKMVGTERTPIQRQIAYPTDVESTPTADVAYLRERTTTAKVKRHRFATPHFHFLPDFQAFLGNKIVPYREDINRQIEIYVEQFYRGYMWNFAPKVFVAGHGMIDAPSAEGNSALSAAGSKTAAWFQDKVYPYCKSHLSFEWLFKALHQAEDEVGCTAFEGDNLNNKWSAPLDNKFALVGDNEVWTQFIDDPWVKENRPINMNIITDGLKGDIFGRIKFRAEYYGLRFKTDNDGIPTLPAPETTLVSADDQNGRTIPNADYSSGAQFGVAWLVGGPSYQVIQVGPPPSEFTGKDVNGIIGMDWNGKINMTRNFLTRCIDADGAEQLETNSWGEYLRLQAQIVCGIIGYNKFNVIPIVYQRKNRITTVS